MGTENVAELDASGRPSRAYLFAGAERIGFRNYSQTALYMKDHLGSTKMTLALDDPDISAVTQVQNSATTGTRALKLDPQAGDSLVKASDIGMHPSATHVVEA